MTERNWEVEKEEWKGRQREKKFRFRPYLKGTYHLRVKKAVEQKTARQKRHVSTIVRGLLKGGRANPTPGVITSDSAWGANSRWPGHECRLEAEVLAQVSYTSSQSPLLQEPRGAVSRAADAAGWPDRTALSACEVLRAGNLHFFFTLAVISEDLLLK